MTFTPTPEQEAIRAAAMESEDSLMIEAMAGTGKTSTLKLVSKVLPVRPSLALAFNVKIKKELEAAFPPHFKVQTMNGLGHVAWGKAIGRRCSVETDKIGTILKSLLKAESIRTEEDDFSTILQLVRRARVMGLVPEGARATTLIPDTPSGWEDVADSLYLDATESQVYLARRVLHECVKLSYQGVLDFDDQIYMSALFGGVFQKYALVMADEAQDLSPLNHIQIRKSAAGRLIVVGDPRQAIYAFRGADSASMGHLRALRPSWIDLPLSVTFRCPKAVVARQQGHALGYTAAAEAPEGEVTLVAPGPWKPEDVALPGPIAILCRNNAPLFAAALRMIGRGVGVTLMGSEVGRALVTLSRKVLPLDETPILDCMILVQDWAEAEISKARANEKESRVALIRDKRDCLVAVMENGTSMRTAADIRQTLASMFTKESLRITLATGHKAKGLEWNTVIHLDPWRVPSKYALKAQSEGDLVPLEQDLNLRYVIETRTQRKLVLGNLEDMV